MDGLSKILVQTGDLVPVLESITTGAKAAGEILDTLEKLSIDWYLSEEGTLMIRYWQVGAENFVSPERAAVIRSSKKSAGQVDELDWLSKNLQDVRAQFGGQWVAVYNNAIVAAAPDLAHLMSKITEFDRPLITFIPADPVVWNFAYAH